MADGTPGTRRDVRHDENRMDTPAPSLHPNAPHNPSAPQCYHPNRDLPNRPAPPPPQCMPNTSVPTPHNLSRNTKHSMPQRTQTQSITTWRASRPSGASMTGARVNIGARMGCALPRRAPAATSASPRKTSTSARNWESVSWQGAPLPPPPPAPPPPSLPSPPPSPVLPTPPRFLPPVLGSTHKHTLQPGYSNDTHRLLCGVCAPASTVKLQDNTRSLRAQRWQQPTPHPIRKADKFARTLPSRGQPQQ